MGRRLNYRIDDLGPGDAERVGRLLEVRRSTDWWRITRRFFIESPERVAVARDRRRSALRLSRLHDSRDGTEVRARGSTRGPVAGSRPRRRSSRRLGHLARLRRLQWRSPRPGAGDAGYGGGAPLGSVESALCVPADQSSESQRAVVCPSARRRAPLRSRPRDRRASDPVPSGRLRSPEGSSRPSARSSTVSWASRRPWPTMIAGLWSSRRSVRRFGTSASRASCRAARWQRE